MNFSISKESLSRLLYLTSTIVERKNTLPILANALITAKEGSISVSATDLEISIYSSAEAEIKAEGSITVGAKVFYDIVKELPDGVVTVKSTKGQRLEIESGQSRFKILGTSADEFPSISGVTLTNPVSVEAQMIYDMLDKTAFAVSNDETRFNISGIGVETFDAPVGSRSKQMLRFVATDGHRLAMVDRLADGLKIDGGMIIPRKAISELKKVLEDNDGAANIGLNENFFTIQSKKNIIGIRLVDGKFPDYKQVIPIENKTTIESNKHELLSAVKRVSLVTSDKSRTIKFRLVDENLVISSSSPEYGEASESISVKQVGENVTIGFSAKYVSDLLSAMDSEEKVYLHLNGELGPGVFIGDSDDRYTCIVMPMRFD